MADGEEIPTVDVNLEEDIPTVDVDLGDRGPVNPKPQDAPMSPSQNFINVSTGVAGIGFKANMPRVAMLSDFGNKQRITKTIDNIASSKPKLDSQYPPTEMELGAYASANKPIDISSDLQLLQYDIANTKPEDRSSIVDYAKSKGITGHELTAIENVVDEQVTPYVQGKSDQSRVGRAFDNGTMAMFKIPAVAITELTTGVDRTEEYKRIGSRIANAFGYPIESKSQSKLLEEMVGLERSNDEKFYDAAADIGAFALSATITGAIMPELSLMKFKDAARASKLATNLIKTTENLGNASIRGGVQFGAQDLIFNAGNNFPESVKNGASVGLSVGGANMILAAGFKPVYEATINKMKSGGSVIPSKVLDVVIGTTIQQAGNYIPAVIGDQKMPTAEEAAIMAFFDLASTLAHVAPQKRLQYIESKISSLIDSGDLTKEEANEEASAMADALSPESMQSILEESNVSNKGATSEPKADVAQEKVTGQPPEISIKEPASITNKSGGEADVLEKPKTSFFKRYFTVEGNLPKDIYSEVEKKNAKIKYGERIVNRISSTAVKEAKKMGYDMSDVSNIENVNRYLSGETSDVPNKLKPVLDEMRAYQDALSKDMIESGIVTGDLASTIEGNLGKYINRSYEMYEYPKEFKKKISEEDYNRTAATLHLIDPSVPKEFIVGELKSMVDNAGKDGFSGINASDGIFKRIKDVPDVLRDFMGEIKDPFTAWTISARKSQRLLESRKTAREIQSIGDGKYFFEEKRGDFFAPVKFFDENGKESTRYTTKEIAEALSGRYDPEMDAKFMRVVRQFNELKALKKLNSITKAGMTIGNFPPGTLRNLYGSVRMGLSNGHFTNPKIAWEAIKATKSEVSGKQYPIEKELVELGIVDEGVNSKEIEYYIKNLVDGGDVESFSKNIVDKTKKLAANATGKAFDKLATLWRAGDDFVKINGYLSEYERYKKIYGGDEAAAKRKAAEIIKNTLPTFSKAPEIVRVMRDNPAVAPFIVFQSERIRNTVNTAKLIREELNDPKTRKIGAERLASQIAVGFAPVGIASLMAYNNGFDDDDVKRVHSMLPDYSKNHNIYILGRDGDGKIKYMDDGFSDPDAYLKSIFFSALRGEDVGQSISDMSSAFLEPWVQPEIFTGSMIDVILNKDRVTGKSISFAADAPSKQLSDRVSYLLDKTKPGVVGGMTRIYKSLNGIEGYGGKQYELDNELSSFLGGIRRSTLDPAKAVYYNAKTVSELLRSDKASIKNASNDGKTSELAELKESSEYVDGKKKYLRKKYLDAISLGANKTRLDEYINKAGLPVPVRDYVKFGR